MSLDSLLPKIVLRRAEVGDLSIFYREVGDRDRPTILLLHGLPTSSHQFRDLIPRLADRYHVVAPDFLPAGAKAFRRDLPKAEVLFLDAGHFALETHAREIAAHVRDFLGRRLS